MMRNVVSLTPGFNPVKGGNAWAKPFERFCRAGKPLKRFAKWGASTTRLKPGVNENPRLTAFFERRRKLFEKLS
jgi:hypothetical protein